MSYALVTGGSSGIGFAYAAALAKRGYNIFIVSNRDDLNQESQEKLQKQYPNIIVSTLMMDLAQEKSAQDLFDYCHEHNILVDVLVNNAAIDLSNLSEGFFNLGFSLLKIHGSYLFSCFRFYL